MSCNHDAAEMDTAAHWDGLCPICMKERIEGKDAEIARLRAALELIAGNSTDKLQALQAVAALTNIGADHEQTASGK